jgi:hypothetical protein
MQLQARRVFRLALTVALALVAGYGLGMRLPFLAPLFALILTATPGPPMAARQLLGLVLVVMITLGSGLLMIPLLQNYPAAALLVVALGLFFSFYVTVNRGKALVGMLLSIGLTMISAAGLVSFALALAVIKALVAGIVIAVLCNRVAHVFFPEDARAAAPGAAAGGAEQSLWIALRATLIVMPAYFIALTNPAMYMPLIMKSVQLGSAGTVHDARHAGRELLGSTFLAGCLAVLFWVLLKLAPELWLYFGLMLLFMAYIAAWMYRVLPTRYPSTFWQNTGVTLLILLGPAVEDSSNGNDVYQAFAIRMTLFILVTVYAILAMRLLEYWRARRLARRCEPTSEGGLSTC